MKRKEGEEEELKVGELMVIKQSELNFGTEVERRRMFLAPPWWLSGSNLLARPSGKAR